MRKKYFYCNALLAEGQPIERQPCFNVDIYCSAVICADVSLLHMCTDSAINHCNQMHTRVNP